MEPEHGMCARAIKHDGDDPNDNTVDYAAPLSDPIATLPRGYHLHPAWALTQPGWGLCILRCVLASLFTDSHFLFTPVNFMYHARMSNRDGEGREGMYCTDLDRQLMDMKGAVLRLGEDVEGAIARSLEALLERDRSLAATVIAGDDALDHATMRIQERGALLISLQQPAAGDLRAVLAALSIAEDLERMGDHAEGIARLLQLPQEPDARVCATLRALGTLARVQVRDALDAYRSTDVARARVVWQSDDAVDRLHTTLVATVLDRMNRVTGGEALTTDTYMLWVSHNLERIADRASNVCERVLFIATGERRPRLAS